MTENDTGYLGISAHGIVTITTELLWFQRKNHSDTKDTCYTGDQNIISVCIKLGFGVYKNYPEKLGKHKLYFEQNFVSNAAFH